MNTREEAAFTLGQDSAARQHALHAYLSEIRAEQSDAARTAWVLERIELVALLRSICFDLGEPSDWPEDLSVVDVLQRWIRPHLP